MLRFLLLPALCLIAWPSMAQYAGSSIGLVITGSTPNDELTLGGQFGLGLEGEHRLGIGQFKGTYRATVGYAESFRAQGKSLFPTRVDAGLRYDFLEDRNRPYVTGAFSYFQLSNPPSGYQEHTRLVAPALRVGFERYLVAEISVGAELGLAWFLVVDGTDPLLVDGFLTLRTHY